MSDLILSTSNSKVKELVKLRESAKKRREKMSFVVEGFADLKCILDSDRKIEELYFCSELVKKAGLEPELKALKKIGFSSIEMSRQPFLKASYRRSSDGILGKVKSWELSIEGLIDTNHQNCIVLDKVEKPGNLGAIVRTAEALGIKTLLLSDPAVDYFNPNVVRSSRGLIGALNVAVGSKNEVLSFLRTNNFSILGTSGSALQSYWDFNYNAKTAFLFGSEKDGLGSFWLQQVDDLVAIPMYGKANSLNLNISVACIVAEYNRKKLN